MQGADQIWNNWLHKRRGADKIWNNITTCAASQPEVRTVVLTENKKTQSDIIWNFCEKDNHKKEERGWYESEVSEGDNTFW